MRENGSKTNAFLFGNLKNGSVFLYLSYIFSISPKYKNHSVFPVDKYALRIQLQLTRIRVLILRDC